ncbi:MAG: aspartate carbamoyltransferase regulatory subunit [Clostridia bacterium]|nr:aspartate carbamoyltransferase regulatory subunit [Clostridia bacterium]
MKIDAIKDGIVIDHVTAGRGMTLYHYLGLDALDCTVALIKNVSSRKMGKKDIIKIDADFGVDTDVLGYVDPGVTVNVIKNGEIVEKKKIELPEILNGVIRCKNPRCITSTEHSLPQRFRLTDPSGPVYRCVWCEARAKTDFDNK